LKNEEKISALKFLLNPGNIENLLEVILLEAELLD
jgi:hypothetical protein